MWSNTKLLAFSSLFVIITGLGFLWFGLNQSAPVKPISVQSEQSPLPSIITEITKTSPKDASSSATQGVSGEKVLVSRVVDGDTIVIADGQTVRFVGVDTPETVDPRRPVGCFGKEASNEVKKLLTGKEIILQKDVSETDKYKRLLRLIFLPLPDGEILFVNDYLVREGFARVMTYPPDIKYNEQFRQAEADAKKDSRGLWGRCN